MSKPEKSPGKTNNRPGNLIKIPIVFRSLLGIAALLLSGCGSAPVSTSLPTYSILVQSAIPPASPTPVFATASAPSSSNMTTNPAPTAQPSFPDPAGYAWTPVASGLDLPVDIQNAGDGSGRLFIVEKGGQILILKDGGVLPVPFLDISVEVDSQSTEQGLVGLAFHPDYAQSGQFFVNYIDREGNTVIARFSVSSNNPDLADPVSEEDLLHVKQPYPNHNGGGLAFGQDGYLYIGLGDGGSGGDPLGNAQNLQTLLGKMLRIDVDHGSPFSIPADNPFVSGGGLPEIWGYGLRNPFRFSFDRQTGDLFIGDVGQDSWEEVDFIPKGTPGGVNFGWNFYEGNHPYRGKPPANVHFTFPVAEYSHVQGCAITGGYVYRGKALSDWLGIYLFGDYCSGNIWGIIPLNGKAQAEKLLFSTGAQITSFGVDEDGEIYLADYKTGSLLELTMRQ